MSSLLNVGVMYARNFARRAAHARLVAVAAALSARQNRPVKLTEICEGVPA